MENTKNSLSSQNITKIIVAVCIVLVIVVIIFSSANHQTTQDTKNKQSTNTAVTPLPTVKLEEMTLQVQPIKITPSASSSTIVHVSLNTAASAVTGVQFGLRYDPTALSVQNVEPTTLLPHHQVLFSLNDSKAGVVSFAEFITPNASPVKGSGSVADITFTVKNPQASNLSISLIPSKTLVTSPGLTLRPISGSDTNATTTITLSSHFTNIK